MKDHSHTPASPRWLHALAVLTVLLTLPLLFLGAGVTSHGVGMVDPQGFRAPWVIVNGLLENSGLAWRLEYGHRTFGFLVGMCAIALMIGCWVWAFLAHRPWLGLIATLALAMICVQGLLGIFRVDYNALHGRTFAMVHGVFAQLVFAVLVSVALFTSRRWSADPFDTPAPAVKRWSIVTALLVFVQLILGGLVRHQPDSLLGPRGHLLGAFVVSVAIVWLLKVIRDSESYERYKVQRMLLMSFLAVQMLLGVESWLAKFYVPTADLAQLAPLPMHAEWLRTVHYLMGTLIFSTTVVVALIAHRKPVLMTQVVPAPVRELEGAL